MKDHSQIQQKMQVQPGSYLQHCLLSLKNVNPDGFEKIGKDL